jgi:hypothetical protein
VSKDPISAAFGTGVLDLPATGLDGVHEHGLTFGLWLGLRFWFGIGFRVGLPIPTTIPWG